MMEDRERLGRRLLALAGLWLLVSGLLLVFSLVIVAVVAIATLLLVALAIGGIWLAPRVRVRDTAETLLEPTTNGLRRFGGRLRALALRRRVGRRLGRVRARAGGAAAGAPGTANALATRSVRAYALTVYWLSARISRLLRAGGRRRALRLNERGAELRRRGEHEEAVRQHRVALSITRDLGDVHVEAMTLNNLALALAQSGAEREAVQHLERALDVLRELGDEEHEGQVIANLGIVYRRQGHSEEAVTLFQEALDRLPPESWEYRQVEEELRRAS